MRIMSRVGIVSALALVLCVAVGAGKPAQENWTRWGGPTEEFRASSTGLAKTWPEEGPRQLWSRELGEGYSAVLYADGRLYTMARENDREVVLCMKAKNGKTLWRHEYDASPAEGHVHQFGDGPRATPLIAGGMIYTIGVSGRMHALKTSNGKVVWSHDLWGEKFGGNVLEHGYSSSPVAYKDTVIVLVGGEGASIVAFDRKTGEVRWKKHDFQNSYSSPRLLDVDGEQQLVTFMAQELIGLDPDDGELKWRFPHENQFGQNISMPMMADSKHLLLSSPQVGAKGLRLTREGDETQVEEIWATRKIQFYHVNTVRDGDWVYGTTGTQSPAFLSAINIKTGEIGWRKRGFAKANCVWADGRLYIVDEDGTVAMTTPSPEDLEIHAKIEGMLEGVAWTAPTIVGKTMYVRDKTRLIALDLG